MTSMTWSVYKVLGLIVILIFALVTAFFMLPKQTSPVSSTSTSQSMQLESKTPASLQFGTTTLSIETADTNEKRVRGLSGRESLPPTTGLLFVFDVPGRHGIWMKEMRFPIDIFWLDKEWKVVHIEHAVHPDTFPQTFRPEVDASYVLETNAGVAHQNDIKVGDMARAISGN